MPTLKEQHLEAMRDNVTCDTGQWGECGGINYESRDKAAESCSAISEKYAAGFAVYIAMENWEYQPVHHGWWNSKLRKEVTTAQLRQLYNEFLNNLK